MNGYLPICQNLHANEASQGGSSYGQTEMLQARRQPSIGQGCRTSMQYVITRTRLRRRNAWGLHLHVAYILFCCQDFSPRTVNTAVNGRPCRCRELECRCRELENFITAVIERSKLFHVRRNNSLRSLRTEALACVLMAPARTYHPHMHDKGRHHVYPPMTATASMSCSFNLVG